ncbi:hypothetical protein [Selenomonas sp. KH1T6]|uniref:hypothetical protein n=1 Tax=Selenomonas sp. KH1T6 TaxID=3158784 RepID=UPI0008A75FE3|nr:protein of unknown function [Selenomonas ruminantium]
MTKQKSLFSILVVFSIFLLAACSQSAIEPADAGIKTYCKAILDIDDESTKKARLPKDELEKTMVSVFANAFQSSSNGMFNKEQSERIGNAFLDELKKIQVETKLIEGKDKKATVEVTVNQIDLKELNSAAIEKDVKDKGKNLKTKEEAIEEVTNATIEEIKKIEPKGNVSFTVDCTYSDIKKIWEPNDVSSFAKDLISTAVKM